jgi:hypothetical protein
MKPCEDVGCAAATQQSAVDLTNAADRTDDGV